MAVGRQLLNNPASHLRAALIRLPGGTWRYYAGFAVGRLAGLVILPVTSRALGVEGFGRFEAAFAIFIAATIVLDAGQGAALVRYVGERGQDTGALVHAAARIQLAASALAVVALAPPLLLFATPHDRPALLLVALVTFAFVEGMAVIGGGLLRATDRDGLFAVLSLVRLCLTAFVGAVGALTLGASGALFGVAVGGAGFAAFAIREVVSADATRARPEQKRLVRYGVPLLATTAASWTLGLSDRLFLRAFAPDRVLGAYAANYRLGSVLLIFVASPLGLTWIPAARRAVADGRLEQVARRWFIALSLTCAAGTLALLVLGPELVPLLFGNRFAFDPFIVAAVGASAWPVGLYFLLATSILLSEDTRRLAVLSCAVVLVNIAANATLIPRFDAHGAAVATLISYGALSFGALAVSSRPRATWIWEPRNLGVLSGLIALLSVGALNRTAALVGLFALLVLLGAIAKANAIGTFEERLAVDEVPPTAETR
jgi:O-antigen/teichoic acid export membrane protein